jgi:AraC family transcriptional regulator
MSASTERDYRERITRTLVYIQEHLDNDLDLERLAPVAAFESFTRAFGDMFGVSPSAYWAAHKPAPESASCTHLGDVSSYHSPDYPDVPPMPVVFLRLGPGMKMIGIVYDDPEVTPADKIRYDAAVMVSRPMQPEIGKAYQRIFGGWLPKSGYVPRDAPGFEVYLNSPQHNRPEDLLTAIHIPLEAQP